MKKSRDAEKQLKYKDQTRSLNRYLESAITPAKGTDLAYHRGYIK